MEEDEKKERGRTKRGDRETAGWKAVLQIGTPRGRRRVVCKLRLRGEGGQCVIDW